MMMTMGVGARVVVVVVVVHDDGGTVRVEGWGCEDRL